MDPTPSPPFTGPVPLEKITYEYIVEPTGTEGVDYSPAVNFFTEGELYKWNHDSYGLLSF